MEYDEKLMELRRLNSDLIFFKNLQQSFCLDDNRIQAELKLWVSTKENDMIICINEMSGFQIKK